MLPTALLLLLLLLGAQVEALLQESSILKAPTSIMEDDTIQSACI